MKKSCKIFCILCVIFLLFTSICFATTNTKDEINSDVLITQDNVVIDEIVNGSLYLVGNDIKVMSPEINGNVFALGNEIEISGKINGSVYAISYDIEISGDVEDLYIITNDLEILEKASCRDVKVIGNSVDVEGLINRDLYAISNEVNIKNAENSNVNGVLYATGNVTGKTDKINEISKIDINFEKNNVFAETFVKVVRTIYFISTSVMAFLIIAIIVLCTKKCDVYKTDIQEMFLKDTLSGIVCWCVCILITIALCITIIGIPFAIFFAGIIWLLFWKINLPIASIEISKFILKNNTNSKWKMFFVAFVVFVGIQLIDLIPMVGSFIKYIISLYGFGFIYRKVFKRDKERKIEVEIIEENKESI